MNNYNHCIFTGRLGRDPELKYLPTGTAVCSFSLAVSRKYKDKESTLWMDCAVFGKSGENAAQLLSKGNLALVAGMLQEQTWEKDDGTKMKRVQLLVNDWQNMTPRPQGGTP